MWSRIAGRMNMVEQVQSCREKKSGCLELLQRKGEDEKMINPQGGKPKRGVSLYSYSGEYGVTMTLEDMFAEIHSIDAKGVEILANAHIEGYPNPSEEWLENWDRLIEMYELVPAEYGHWVDSRLYPGRELTTQESYEMLIRDIKLASRLGFKVLRTKLGVIDDILTPVANWREFIEMALAWRRTSTFPMSLT